MAKGPAPKGENRLSEQLVIPITLKDEHSIKAVAQALGMTKTEWCRQTILEALCPPPETQS